MFTFLSRFRRQTAVLTALALVASVLVAVPVSAADDDPKADYTATFSACVGGAAGDAGFTDVPAGHENAGDINCIGYYGITLGTSPSTYSPLMSVTREHMALFLTRLAGLVGIEMVSDPDDAGFTDIGDLSDESQTAINQLADLGITQGTSDTTYSPADPVQRGHMALFISRLMDQMDPMAEDSETPFGYTPEDVVDKKDSDDTDDVDDSKTVESPFTDLGSTTKTTYDAITALWELGVASGLSDTAYGPAASITRASMAGFMAGVLDHSNARPAGVSIQASKTWDFGTFSPTVAVSYRDASFAPMVDVSVKTFSSDDVGAFTENGGCKTPADCAWTDDDSLTDGSGNIYLTGNVTDGEMNTYYAWMGDPDADDNDFVLGMSDEASVTLSSTSDAVNLKVTSDINSNSTGGNTEDIDGDGSVTHTVQLVDGDSAAVAKSGVEITVEWRQNPAVGDEVTVYPAPAPLKTDDNGQATFTTSGPKSTKGNTDDDRTDTLTFRSDVDGGGTVGDPAGTAGDPAETVVKTILWTDSDATLVSVTESDSGQSRTAVGKGTGSTPDYSLRNSKNEVTIRASVSFYDQYGDPAGKGNTVAITIGSNDAVQRTVSSRGMASWRGTVVQATLNGPVTVQYALQDDQGNALADAPPIANTTVFAVEHAPDDSSQDAIAISAVYGDENRFNIGGLLYTYDDDDVFISDDGDTDGAIVDLAKFEMLIGANMDDQPTTQANIEVVAYDDDGTSYFRVGTAAS